MRYAPESDSIYACTLQYVDSANPVDSHTAGSCRRFSECSQAENIELKILCGSEGEDCLSMAEKLFEAVNKEGIQAEITVSKGNRHQFYVETVELINLRGIKKWMTGL